MVFSLGSDEARASVDGGGVDMDGVMAMRVVLVLAALGLVARGVWRAIRSSDPRPLLPGGVDLALGGLVSAGVFWVSFRFMGAGWLLSTDEWTSSYALLGSFSALVFADVGRPSILHALWAGPVEALMGPLGVLWGHGLAFAVTLAAVSRFVRERSGDRAIGWVAMLLLTASLNVWLMETSVRSYAVSWMLGFLALGAAPRTAFALVGLACLDDPLALLWLAALWWGLPERDRWDGALVGAIALLASQAALAHGLGDGGQNGPVQTEGMWGLALGAVAVVVGGARSRTRDAQALALAAYSLLVVLAVVVGLGALEFKYLRWGWPLTLSVATTWALAYRGQPQVRWWMPAVLVVAWVEGGWEGFLPMSATLPAALILWPWRRRWAGALVVFVFITSGEHFLSEVHRKVQEVDRWLTVVERLQPTTSGQLAVFPERHRGRVVSWMLAREGGEVSSDDFPAGPPSCPSTEPVWFLWDARQNDPQIHRLQENCAPCNGQPIAVHPFYGVQCGGTRGETNTP